MLSEYIHNTIQTMTITSSLILQILYCSNSLTLVTDSETYRVILDKVELSTALNID
jgi:hypothetical protein